MDFKRIKNNCTYAKIDNISPYIENIIFEFLEGKIRNILNYWLDKAYNPISNTPNDYMWLLTMYTSKADKVLIIILGNERNAHWILTILNFNFGFLSPIIALILPFCMSIIGVNLPNLAMSAPIICSDIACHFILWRITPDYVPWLIIVSTLIIIYRTLCWSMTLLS